ncbi:Pycsar system effector family protein [Umezawaea sp. NPDC059074]|uniref:Pycsar system effector family protein n=1 Tax=Umezawaea sp. NPDC059074 TaxID=3346716 RepID=UPI0036C8D439
MTEPLLRPRGAVAKTVRRRRDDVGEAHFAITQFSGWVANADTKAGLLATATIVLGGTLAGQRAEIRASFTPTTWHEWVRAVVMALTLVAVPAAVLALTAALRPRVLDGSRSRYSWPSVAATPVRDLPRSKRSAADEAWLAAHDLAVIARQKFRWLRIALLAWVVGALGLFAWFLLAP